MDGSGARRECDRIISTGRSLQVGRALSGTASSHSHPLVQGASMYYWWQNWLTCDTCKLWANISKDLMQLEEFVKAFKGLSWMVCAS